MRTLVFLSFLLAGCGAPQAAKENSSSPAAKLQIANPDSPSSGSASNATVQSSGPMHPCMTQDGKPVTQKLKALGTEPFWAAEVDGRCVTYKTPEDQRGTRVWTHIEEKPHGTDWIGALNGRQFQLSVKPGAGCSDGMSDRTYPMDVVLRVLGETRRGCAAPLSDQLKVSPAAPD